MEIKLSGNYEEDINMLINIISSQVDIDGCRYGIILNNQEKINNLEDEIKKLKSQLKTSMSRQAIKDHEMPYLINSIRDIANKYAGKGDLRCRIKDCLMMNLFKSPT